MSNNNIGGAVGMESDGESGVFICQICSNTLTNNEEISANKCGHVFHTRCIQEWIGRSNICPKCRTQEPTPVRLYLDYEDCKTIENKYNKMISEQKIMLDSAKEQVNILNDKLKSSEAMLDSVQIEMQSLQDQLQDRDAYVESLNTELSKIKKEIEVAKQSEASLKSILEESHIIVDSANTELINRERQLKEKDVLLESITTELNHIKENSRKDIENDVTTIIEIRGQLEEKDTIIEASKAENSKLKEELQSVGQVTEGLSNEISRIEALLKQSKDNELKSNGTITELKTQLEEKMAIEVTLEEKLRQVNLLSEHYASELAEIQNFLAEAQNRSKATENNLLNAVKELESKRNLLSVRDSIIEKLKEHLRNTVEKRIEYENSCHDSETELNEIIAQLDIS